MTRRFITQNFFRDPFVRGLEGALKGLYVYLFLDCSNAGVWDVELDVARLRCGVDPSYTNEEIIKLFSEKIVIFSDGEKWLIKNFLKVQHGGVLKPNNPATKKAIFELLNYGFLEKNEEEFYELKKGLCMPLERGYSRGTSIGIGIGIGIGRGIGKEKIKKKEILEIPKNYRPDMFRVDVVDFIKSVNPSYRMAAFESKFVNDLFEKMKAGFEESEIEMTSESVKGSLKLIYDKSKFFKNHMKGLKSLASNFDAMVADVKNPYSKKSFDKQNQMEQMSELDKKYANE